MMIKSAYIHIPFCVNICTYCDFNKYFIQNQPVDAYIDALIKEMHFDSKQTLETLFVGGGTPTALTIKQLDKLLLAIENQFNILGEYTFEANPDELTEEKIKLLKSYGVNRLSMGVQTFDDALLKLLGRTHKTQDIYQAVEFAKKFNIPSVSLDLMYHLPTQTLEQFNHSLNEALALDIDHISCYGLILEPQTQFYNLYRKGKLILPSDTLGAEMYEHLMKKMKQTEMHQYEISNFAKSGHESQHNKVYWKNESYYGFGAGASGYVNGCRYTNVKPVNHYIQHVTNNEKPILEKSFPTVKEQIEEEMFLGLRMNQGVNKTIFHQKYNENIDHLFERQLLTLENKGWINNDKNTVSLTDQGRIVGNEVFEAFIEI
ncbi:radical SAM family heme chaperone HemW [Staphylococcus chromogenes]|uniref:radical SAM family heme chaperone HemW n=1 Tax=Staphylococcus chromogenes TaxID=46126 RepID=UPI000D0269F9|nr:radical SAM family heme chaperone HemW [Staphylococcus chromogenes]PTF59015.1 oxygen-independent coproporphyrinogen III oxidase [Staphylococcus chromogenes]PTF77911.1 oxygen-independent coproporphyrinogen III oxidase [Staphylococcus chromogenes]PTF86809.1 oxygen-independent coproporphyrinogen III oxidase [Staphylococcus chromogenes]PTG46697.1 oxygen-independent coproporphyrinogen III oxidase [Staphylococcus chromogenes]PUZ10370.1 oxygen-independent coproporphyrinogen III oxidase [Staphyloco